MNDTRESYVRQWHAELCATQRRQMLNVENEPCKHCHRPKSEHYRGKCSSYVTSLEYRAENHMEVATTTATLEIVEKLAAVCGWKL